MFHYQLLFVYISDFENFTDLVNFKIFLQPVEFLCVVLDFIPFQFQYFNLLCTLFI